MLQLLSEREVVGLQSRVQPVFSLSLHSGYILVFFLLTILTDFMSQSYLQCVLTFNKTFFILQNNKGYEIKIDTM